LLRVNSFYFEESVENESTEMLGRKVSVSFWIRETIQKLTERLTFI